MADMSALLAGRLVLNVWPDISQDSTVTLSGSLFKQADAVTAVTHDEQVCDVMLLTVYIFEAVNRGPKDLLENRSRVGTHIAGKLFWRIAALNERQTFNPIAIKLLQFIRMPCI